MLSDMAEDADRLHSIIENLLHLTRLGSGSALDLEPQVIDRVVDRAVRSFRARNRTRQVELVTSEPSAVVDGEETYLALLLENLLTNAVKYSAPPAPIEIEVGTEGDEVFVVVRDRGIDFGDGPPQALFEPFYRSTEAKAAANGLGIGLALCQRTVATLNGRIWTNPREGGGGEIGFALPIQRPAIELGWTLVSGSSASSRRLGPRAPGAHPSRSEAAQTGR